MTKSEFIAALAEKLEKPKTECEAFLKGVASTVLDCLSKKENIPFGDLGQFKYKKSAARTCKVIKTGALINIPEKGSASFALSKGSKETLSKIV